MCNSCHTVPNLMDTVSSFITSFAISVCFVFQTSVLAACKCHPAMAQQDSGAKKNPAVAALHSHFIVGSVSEENSEDEIQGKQEVPLEEKETRSLSPSSSSSDSPYEIVCDQNDGPTHNLRLDSTPGCCTVTS